MVFENDYWYSDEWDPATYGRAFDFSRPFFEQFKELQDQVPHRALNVVKPTLQNSDYCNQVTAAKDCYLIFDSRFSEKCLYGKSMERLINRIVALDVRQARRKRWKPISAGIASMLLLAVCSAVLYRIDFAGQLIDYLSLVTGGNG